MILREVILWNAADHCYLMDGKWVRYDNFNNIDQMKIRLNEGEKSCCLLHKYIKIIIKSTDSVHKVNFILCYIFSGADITEAYYNFTTKMIFHFDSR